MEFMFHAAHAPMKTVYTRLAYQSLSLRFGWIALQPMRCRLKYQAGVEPVAGLESKLRQDITPMPDADPLLGSVASEVVRYLAAFAIPGISVFIAAAIGRGVEPIVNPFPSEVVFTFNWYSLSFFTLALSKVSSSSAHKKISPAQAIPIANPNMLRKL